MHPIGAVSEIDRAVSATAFEPELAAYERDGFLGPYSIFSRAECRAILDRFASRTAQVQAAWHKGRALDDWLLGKVAADPRLLKLLTPILGENIVLWGSKLAQRTPGMVHSWHVDIETSDPQGRFATVWIGLDNTSQASSLGMIAGSHRCGKPIQQFAAEHGEKRGTATPRVMEWAKSANPDARVVWPDMSDGDALIFDGRLWHGSRNRSASTRNALLLQYASAECLVREADKDVLTWPFKFLDAPPPVLLVQGSAAAAANPVRSPPSPSAPRPPLPSSVSKLKLPLSESEDRTWRRYPIFHGSTPALASISHHGAVLSPGFSPHPPHAHRDEELLIVLDGEAELLIADRPEYEGARALRVGAGDFAFYPSRQHHTIRNPTDVPLTYMMFRWHGAAPLGSDALRPKVVRSPPNPEPVAGRNFTVRRILDGQTRWLRKLHCHTSRLEVGGGYAPHADGYDVAIYIRSGRVRTLRTEASAGSVIFYPAGEVHGMRNVGDEPATYMVFEFHGAPLPAATLPRPGQRALSAAN